MDLGDAEKLVGSCKPIRVVFAVGADTTQLLLLLDCCTQYVCLDEK